MSRSKKSDQNNDHVDFLMNEDFLSPRSTGFKSSSTSQWIQSPLLSRVQYSPDTSMQQMASNINDADVNIHAPHSPPTNNNYESPFSPSLFSPQLRKSNKQNRRSNPTEFDDIKFPDMHGNIMNDFGSVSNTIQSNNNNNNNNNNANTSGTGKTKPPKSSKKKANQNRNQNQYHNQTIGETLTGSYDDLGYNNNNMLSQEHKSASVCDNEPTSEDYSLLYSPSVENIRSSLIKSCHNHNPNSPAISASISASASVSTNLMKDMSTEDPMIVDRDRLNSSHVSNCSSTGTGGGGGGFNINTNTSGSMNTSMNASHVSPEDDRVKCNCKKSKCLKLYCQCFAVVQYCDPTVCKCVECNNCMAFEEVRQDAIKQTKERNRQAFVVKVSDEVCIYIYAYLYVYVIVLICCRFDCY